MDIRKAGGSLMVICGEALGRFEIDPESVGPLQSCVYSRLIRLGYNSDSLASAVDKHSASVNYLYNLARPG